MAKPALGVDIGTRTITVAEVRPARGRIAIANFGGVELPGGAVREGEIIDVEMVASALRTLMSSAGIREKRVWLGVANQRVVVRQVDLPWVDEAELRASLRYQVQDFIPIPVEDAELDVHVVDEVVTEQGERMRRVLLVAAQREMINAHMEAARQAGLKPQGIDLNPFAVLRVLGGINQFAAGEEILIDIGAGVTNIVVHRAGIPTFVRILVMGGDEITEGLVDGLGVDWARAEAAKREATAGYGDDLANRIVTERAEQFVDEIRSSLDYFQAQSPSTNFGSVILTGGGSGLRGLPERLADALRLPVEVGNAFDHLKVKRTVYGPEDLARVGPTLTTAIGLGMGGLE